MDIKKGKLSSEQLSQLLKNIAEDERKLADRGLNDDELLAEEVEHEKKLREFLAKAKINPSTTDAEDQKIEQFSQDQLRRERNLKAIKAKLESFEASSEEASDSEPGTEKVKSRKAPASKTKRWAQISTFVAVAALLALVVRFNPESTSPIPTAGDDPGNIYKGDSEVDLADCDYDLLQHPNEMLRSDGLETSFTTSERGAFDIIVKCVPAQGFLHVRIVAENETPEQFLNFEIETSQRQFLRLDADDGGRKSPFTIDTDSIKAYLYLTPEPLAETVELPDDLSIRAVGGQNLLWADEMLISIESGDE